jgi:two-component system LytT family sensor kinase
VFERLQASFRHTALAPTLVIWGFGYVLVDAVAVVLGRASPGVTVLTSLPMFVLGVGLTLALNLLRGELLSRSVVVRWLGLFLALHLATAIQSLFDVYWVRWLALTVFPGWQDWALDMGLQRLLTTGVIYFWTFCLALTLLWAARLSSKADASVARAASAEAAAAKAVAAALRLQLNPHFLFNTLNSISSLVTLGRAREAERMIDRLSDFLRASLSADPMEDIPLAVEIEVVEAYLDIEASRFGDRLRIEIDIAPGLDDVGVPNFILQPLVENAIKHGVSALKGPARLTIGAEREGEQLVLRVANSSPEQGDAAEDHGDERPRTGIGLSNNRQRLANRYGSRATLETRKIASGFEAILRIPLNG